MEPLSVEKRHNLENMDSYGDPLTWEATSFDDERLEDAENSRPMREKEMCPVASDPFDDECLVDVISYGLHNSSNHCRSISLSLSLTLYLSLSLSLSLKLLCEVIQGFSQRAWYFRCGL